MGRLRDAWRRAKYRQAVEQGKIITLITDGPVTQESFTAWLNGQAASPVARQEPPDDPKTGMYL